MNKKINLKNIFKLVPIAIIFIFSIVFMYSFFSPSNVYYEENNFISLIVTGVLFGLLFIIYKKIIYNKSNIRLKKEIIIVSIIFALILLIEYVVLKYLSVLPTWDFGFLYISADSYVSTGVRESFWYPGYFEFYPNNILLFAMLVKVFRIGTALGISLMHSAWLMNIVFINLSYIMLYLTLRKKFGNRVAIFGLCISLLFVAPFMYSSIFYSDTLSMFVGISFIFIYNLIDYNKKISVKNVILFIALGILMFYGKSIKVTSLIPLIAIIISIVLDKNKRKVLVNLSFTFIVFFSISFMFKTIFVDNEVFAFKEGNYGKLPYTHWVMMGIEDISRKDPIRNSYGGYNQNDVDFTMSFATGKEASKHNIEEIISRIKKMGAGGYFNFLCKKAVNAWTDGLYFVDIKLQLSNLHEDGKLYNELFNNKTNFYTLVHFSQGVQYLFIFSLMIGSAFKLHMNNKELDVVRLSIIGVFVFLLLWENRSGYLLNFIPLFIYIICEFYVLLGMRQKSKQVPND